LEETRKRAQKGVPMTELEQATERPITNVTFGQEIQAKEGTQFFLIPYINGYSNTAGITVRLKNGENQVDIGENTEIYLPLMKRAQGIIAPEAMISLVSVFQESSDLESMGKSIVAYLLPLMLIEDVKVHIGLEGDYDVTFLFTYDGETASGWEERDNMENFFILPNVKKSDTDEK